MLFHETEINELRELFAFEKSDLEKDFSEIELEAIKKLQRAAKAWY